MDVSNEDVLRKANEVGICWTSHGNTNTDRQAMC